MNEFSENYEDAIVTGLESVKDEIRSYDGEGEIGYDADNIFVGEMHVYGPPGLEAVEDTLNEGDIEALGLEFVDRDHEKVTEFNKGDISAAEMARFYRNSMRSFTGRGSDRDMTRMKHVFSEIEQEDIDIIGLEPKDDRYTDSRQPQAPHKDRWDYMAEVVEEVDQDYQRAVHLAGTEHIGEELGMVFSIPSYLSQVPNLPENFVEAYNTGEVSDQEVLRAAYALTDTEVIEPSQRFENRVDDSESVLTLTPQQLRKSFDRSMNSDELDSFIQSSPEIREQIRDIHDTISQLEQGESESGYGHKVSVK